MTVKVHGAVSFRAFEPTDADAVAALEADAFPAAQWTPDSLRDVAGRPDWPFLVATRDDVVVGFAVAVAASEVADILTMAITPSERRRGLGAALLDALEAELAARGVTSITLEVRIGNRAARSLYRAAGYVEVGERPRYYANGEDAVVMRKGQ